MLPIQVTMPSLLKIYVRKLSVVCLIMALVAFAWGNVFFHTDLNAYAATAEGLNNQIQGKIEKDFGTARRNIGDLTDDDSEEINGGLQQAKGKVTQGVGAAQNKLDDTKNKAENKSESLIDSVKDFFE
ncbi:MAG: CsbD-like [Cyanobacteriota bacterium]